MSCARQHACATGFAVASRGDGRRCLGALAGNVTRSSRARGDAHLDAASRLLFTSAMPLPHVVALAVSVVSLGALAEEPPSPNERERSSFIYELNMGFTGGLIDPSSLPLVFEKGDAASVAGATGLTAPFGGPALGSLIVAGPTWEMRTTYSHVRFTAGLSKPFAQFRQGALDAETNVGGSPLVGPPIPVSPRSLSLWVFRLGLGGEYTFGRVTPFVDLVGDIQLANAEVVVAGQRGTYQSAGFGFSVRAGTRVRIDHALFVGVSGEYGLVGAPRVGASVVAGWAFDLDD